MTVLFPAGMVGAGLGLVWMSLFPQASSRAHSGRCQLVVRRSLSLARRHPPGLSWSVGHLAALCCAAACVAGVVVHASVDIPAFSVMGAVVGGQFPLRLARGRVRHVARQHCDAGSDHAITTALLASIARIIVVSLWLVLTAIAARSWGLRCYRTALGSALLIEGASFALLLDIVMARIGRGATLPRGLR